VKSKLNRNLSVKITECVCNSTNVLSRITQHNYAKCDFGKSGDVHMSACDKSVPNGDEMIVASRNLYCLRQKDRPCLQISATYDVA